jgi:outer membrane autotransporter protein
LNTVFRIVWNAARQCWVVASEIARGKTKSGRRGRDQGRSAGSNRRHARLLTGGALLWLAAAVLSPQAHAADFAVATQQQLIDAINAANASGDASSTITLTGSFTITGSGLPAVAKTLTIDAGAFTLTSSSDLTFGVGTGAELTVNGAVRINGNPGFSGGRLIKNGDGTLNVTGGPSSYVWYIQNTDGALVFKDGAQVTTSSLVAPSASLSSGASSVTVTGTGTVLTDLAAGFLGTATGGTLNIEDGGTYKASTSLFGLSASAGSQGTVNVTGSGSLFQGSIEVLRGVGNVNVLDGGQISSKTVQIGGLAPTINGGGIGNLLVSDVGSRWDNSGAFYLSNGSLSILAGGVVQTSTIGVAFINTTTPVPTASVLVSGAGSQLITTSTAATAFQLGGGSGAKNAILTIADGGEVMLNGGAGTLNIATTATSNAVLNIGGAVGDAATAAGSLDAALVQFGPGTGAVNFNETDSAYQFDALIAGNGTVNQTGPGTTMLTANSTYTGGTTIADGTLQLGNGGTTGSINGDIADDGTLAFDRSDAALTLAGVISGTGAVSQIGSGTSTLTGASSYTGATTISAGTLALAGDGSIAASSGVVDNATFDISAITDSSTSITTLSGNGLVQLGNATLNLSAAQDTFAGTIQGLGGLTVSAGTEILTGSNTYTGTTTIGGGTLQLGNGGTTGSVTSQIIDNGTLAIDRSNAMSLGAITGTGGVNQIGSGTTTLTGPSTYTGATDVDAGTLVAGADHVFSATSNTTVAAGATLDLAGHDQETGSLDNSGTVALSGTVAGTTLTVHGDYTGHDGVLRMGTALGADASVSDLLIIDGGTASGHTSIQLANLGGLGALTTGNGIELISAINGATTTVHTTADAFALAGGHVDAGAFEYNLYAGDASGAGENWYLRSTTDTPPPDGGGEGQAGGSGGGSSGSGNGGSSGNGGGGVVTYRPEAALYSALSGVLRQADLSMLGNLHRRQGDDSSLPDNNGSRTWARVVSENMQTRQSGTVSPSTNGSLQGVQAGVDLMQNGAFRAGVYAGHLRGTVRTDGFVSGIADNRAGNLDVRSTYGGAYGTYMANSGWYADAVLQYGWHDGRADVGSGLRDTAGGNGLQGSLELGKDYPLSAHWMVEPQAQVIVDRMSLDDQAISGASVTMPSSTSMTSRLGIRFKGAYATEHGQMQPYVRFNIWHGSAGSDDVMFAGPAGATTVTAEHGYTSGEVAAGATWTVNPRFNVYGELGHVFTMNKVIGEQVKSNLTGSAGIRFNW